jgi:hypothetical protein
MNKFLVIIPISTWDKLCSGLCVREKNYAGTPMYTYGYAYEPIGVRPIHIRGYAIFPKGKLNMWISFSFLKKKYINYGTH